jgi:hypothetical protein
MQKLTWSTSEGRSSLGVSSGLLQEKQRRPFCFEVRVVTYAPYISILASLGVDKPAFLTVRPVTQDWKIPWPEDDPEFLRSFIFLFGLGKDAARTARVRSSCGCCFPLKFTGVFTPINKTGCEAAMYNLGPINYR